MRPTAHPHPALEEVAADVGLSSDICVGLDGIHGNCGCRVGDSPRGRTQAGRRPGLEPFNLWLMEMGWQRRLGGSSQGESKPGALYL